MPLSRGHGLTFAAVLIAMSSVVADEVVDKSATQPLASPAEMAGAREDVWGEAAIRQPGGPSYEFFRDLLPPLRYVNTEFRHYPLVLSAPRGAVKARWISNGAGINLRANKPPMWREVGVPVSFHVGDDATPFGRDVTRLDGPNYERGWLPIVRIADSHAGTTYEQEAFAACPEGFAEHGAVLVRFTARGAAGVVTARVGTADNPAEFTSRDGSRSVIDKAGSSVVAFDPAWHWIAERRELLAALAVNRSAVLVVFTKPLDKPLPSPLDFEAERRTCIETWQALIDSGARFDIPEPIVQDAWRSLVVGNFLLSSGDRMNYSAGNAYDHLYEAECGDAVRALMQFGHVADSRRMVGPLLDFNRQATRFHVAGHKLQLLAHFYWVTRDAEYLREKEPVWRGVIDFIRTSRKTENGLLPKDNYAGDVNQQIYSLNSNANCWRGLRDMAAVLNDLGERDRSAELFREADDFRRVILDAVGKSERLETKPPFLPISLLGDEPPHDPLTATRIGSYYDLMAPYVLGSEVLGPGSDRETWLIDYLRRHGGIAMGMIRSMPHQGEFNQQPGVNVLYGQRYLLTLLRRDDRDHALAGFYGHLAQGMTRDTFIGGEGSRFFHGDEHGRSFYLPPNSAANAMFLTTLRHLLIQDWDLDSDGRPETLRLLYGIPSRWLNDGAIINVERAPSAFGELSFRVESHLRDDRALVTLHPPPRQPEKCFLRIPTPAGMRITGARVAGREVKLHADGGIDVPHAVETVQVEFQIQDAGPEK